MEKETTILISELRQRKSAACQQLLATYGPMVFRMVQRIVPLREDAEEVYQDVFVKALRGIEGYNPQQATLATWLNRIAYHESLNFIRGKSPVIVSMEDKQEWQMDISDEELEKELSTGREERIQRLEAVIDDLPADERMLLTLYYYEDRPLTEIAYITGIDAKALANRLYRTRKKLFKKLKD